MILHTAVKPSNLMLVKAPEWLVKIIDFGLAKAVVAGPEESALTCGGFVGTPAFASPEQCAGGAVDIRSDLYALGVTLWQMLAGQVPFGGSPAEVIGIHRRAPLPLERLEGVPQPVVVLLQKLLAKEPARRFQTAAQFLQALPRVTAAIKAGRTLTAQRLQKGASLVSGKPSAQRGPEKLSLARLPVTGVNLFGREADLAFLDKAWAHRQVNVVAVVAWAGVGKSTLVNHWLRHLAAKRYGSAELVFGWSFYRQGATAEASSGDEFMDAALSWFGDADPRLGSAWDKGERLARLIAQRRTLLVLDGLEPLQHPPGPQEGRLRDPSLQACLRELAAVNQGLCVITTRLPVTDLAAHEGGSVRRLELEHLSREAGAQLLRALGVKGHEAELQTASEEFGGHCLALTLLGSYLSDVYHGDIGHRNEVSTHLAHDARQGAHARQVMESYQAWFREGPELEALRLIGLFDRPADQKALGALRSAPSIPGLTEALASLSPARWQTVVARLRRARLLAGEDPHQPGQLDAHPLIREYFGEQLRTRWAEAWREGNRRLYEHYRALAPERPETFRAMEPLFLAVAYGCRAGLFRDALHEVYLPRIQQGGAAFAANALGARGALLSVLGHFFEHGNWGELAAGSMGGQRLSAEDELFVLMQAALYLTAVRGHAATEARTCYERAEPLCHSLRRPALLYASLIGQWRHSLMTDSLTATLQLAQRVYVGVQGQPDAALLVGALRALGVTLCFMGRFEAARQHLKRGVEVWRSIGGPSSVEELDAPVVSCLGFRALCEWHLGEMGPCQAAMAEAIALAKALNDLPALAVALFHAATLAHFARQPAEAQRRGAELMELSTRHHFVFWWPIGAVVSGWARGVSGDAVGGLAWIEDGIGEWRRAGSTQLVPYWLSLKAEALHLAGRTSAALEAVQEAEALAERSAEGLWRAELHRLRGVFLAALGADHAQVEAALQEAIRTAHQQKSISLLKRAEASHAEYGRSTGKE